MSHRAAILSNKGGPLDIQTRSTPTPGPNELLITVRAIAVNPIDNMQRNFGFAIEHSPAVIGHDVSGIVTKVGSAVPPDSPLSRYGTRVLAFAPCYYEKGDPNYGAFQQKVLVPYTSAAVIPEATSFAEGAMLPMAVNTVWSGFYSIGLPRQDLVDAAGARGMLIWGGSSSVGTAAVQIAKLQGFTIYAVASEKHHEYVKKLGAARVFDYRQSDVVDQITKAAKSDNLNINVAYDAVGQLKETMEVVSQTKIAGVTGKVMSAPPIKEEPKVHGVEAKFVLAPDSESARREHFGFVNNQWLTQNLVSKGFVPSPALKVVPGGLPKINDALDELKAGVSSTKLVLEVE